MLALGLATGCGSEADVILDFDRGGLPGAVNVYVCPARSTEINTECSRQEVFRDGDQRGSSILGIFVDDDSEEIDVYVVATGICRVATLPTGKHLMIDVQLGPDDFQADSDYTFEVCTDGT